MSRHESAQYSEKALPVGLVMRVLRIQQQRVWRRYAAAFPPDPRQRVLDLGVSGVNTDRSAYFFEENYPYPKQVVAAGLEGPENFQPLYPDIAWRTVRRKERLPFDDGAFDVAFVSAVIEHVGTREDQRRFLAEVLRVARSAFLTTPSRWYPVELHTMLPLLHWLPPAVYRPLYGRLGFPFFGDEQNLNLLDRRSLRALLPTGVSGEVGTLRFLGPVSNLILVVRR